MLSTPSAAAQALSNQLTFIEIIPAAACHANFTK
jgi:hypothetical protein